MNRKKSNNKKRLKIREDSILVKSKRFIIVIVAMIAICIAFNIAENYIKSNMRWKVEFTGELQRKEIPEIPIDAIREALLNSFCHKDYASGQSNEVAIYKDRIEIYNPGAFPEGYEPRDFIDKVERPIRRNPKIAVLSLWLCT